MSATTRSGIKTSDDGNSYIPSSTRADGSTRKVIKVRPGYRPPEDVDTYKSQRAEIWKNRGSGGIPGAESNSEANVSADTKSKNAKRREAARKKREAEVEAEADGTNGEGISDAIGNLAIARNGEVVPTTVESSVDETEVERQKKIRNFLKKLRGVHELKANKSAGEKLSHEQIIKIGKEEELLRDLQKLNYDMSQLEKT